MKTTARLTATLAAALVLGVPTLTANAAPSAPTPKLTGSIDYVTRERISFRFEVSDLAPYEDVEWRAQVLDVTGRPIGGPIDRKMALWAAGPDGEFGAVSAYFNDSKKEPSILQPTITVTTKVRGVTSTLTLKAPRSAGTSTCEVTSAVASTRGTLPKGWRVLCSANLGKDATGRLISAQRNSRLKRIYLKTSMPTQVSSDRALAAQIEAIKAGLKGAK